MANVFKNILKILIGLIVLTIAIVGLMIWPLSWGPDVLVVIKGGVVLLLILMGLLIAIIGLTSFKS